MTAHHQQVLADLRGGSAAVAAPHLVCDAAILLHEAAYVIPHHECGLTGECFQCRAKQGYFVQLSHDRLQLSQVCRPVTRLCSLSWARDHVGDMEFLKIR